MWLLAHKTASSSHRSVFSSHHELRRDRQNFIHQVAGLWIVSYGCVNRLRPFQVTAIELRVCVGLWERHWERRREQNLSKSQRSQCPHHMLWQSLLSLSVRQKGDKDDTQQLSLFMNPIKSKEIFDMYSDTAFYWCWEGVYNITYSSAFQEIRARTGLVLVTLESTP